MPSRARGSPLIPLPVSSTGRPHLWTQQPRQGRWHQRQRPHRSHHRTTRLRFRQQCAVWSQQALRIRSPHPNFYVKPGEDDEHSSSPPGF